jgi:biopolymer transport protein ExbD
VALSATSARAAVKADINVTPLIDVMLVLLIIFMIVTPIIAAGFQATIPRSANPENRPEGPDEVRLGIDKDGKFYLDMGSGPKQIPDDQLPGRLEGVFASRTRDKILFLKADQNIEFGRVQQAIEIARRAGVRVVGAITEQKQSLGPQRRRESN